MLLLVAHMQTAWAQENTHSVRGLVAQAENGIEGIEVVITGQKSDTTQTDAMGEFIFSDLPNGDYTITPTSDTYQFQPENHSLTLTPSGGSFLPVFDAVVATSVDELPDGVDSPVLFPNAPNPFVHKTVMRYQIATPGDVKLAVYDVLGRHVSTLRDAFHEPGLYEIAYVPVDMPAGIYFLRLTSANQQLTRSMILAQ